MKRTFEDVKRHGKILAGIADKLNDDLDGLPFKERRFLVDELAIALLTIITMRDNADVQKVNFEALKRAHEYMDDEDNQYLFIDGKINPDITTH